MNKRAILITISHSAAGQAGEPFPWTVGTCGRAMEMLWSKEGVRKHPAEGAPVVTVDVGGDFILDTRIFLYPVKDQVHAQILQAPEAPVCVQLKGLHDSGSAHGGEDPGSAGCIDLGDCDTFLCEWANQRPDETITVKVEFAGEVCN